MINKKLLILVILTALNGFSMCSNKKSESIDEHAYKFLNDFFARTEMPCFCKYKVEDKFTPWDITKGDIKSLETMDSVFSKADVEFLSQQFSNLKASKIDLEKLNSPKLISSDSLQGFGDNWTKKFWENFENKYHDNLYHSVSIPLFSKDYKKAIIVAMANSEGGAYGASYIFDKRGDIWVPIHQWMMFE